MPLHVTAQLDAPSQTVGGYAAVLDGGDRLCKQRHELPFCIQHPQRAEEVPPHTLVHLVGGHQRMQDGHLLGETNDCLTNRLYRGRGGQCARRQSKPPQGKGSRSGKYGVASRHGAHARIADVLCPIHVYTFHSLLHQWVPQVTDTAAIHRLEYTLK
ncbi:hypothetical protein D3C71_1380020 [compost metagenome]